jgi:uncharacterized protein (DUF433 family)
LTPVPATDDKHIKSTRGDLGKGVYALSDLRAYLSFDTAPDDADLADSARAWTTTRARRPSDAVLPWLTQILNPTRHRARNADYSFSDLVSLFVVRELLKKGVRPWRIREAEDFLRQDLKIDRPFVFEDIKTDGVDVFYRDNVIPTQIEAASLRGQQVFREAIKDRLTSVRYTDGSAAYWVPMPGVIVDPRVQFGEPVVEGTRVPTEAVANVARNLGTERTALRFGLGTELVETAISFEQQLAAAN